MMATTHVFAALAVVTPAAVVVPELAPALAAGALVGGLAPDLDLVLEHRRTLHFPLLGGPLALFAAALAVVTPSSATAFLAAVALAAWLHAMSDALGGGPEMDPWSATSERAVYDHLRGRWLRPRRWIRYDGSPEDAALAVSLAVPAVVVFDGWVRAVVVAGVAVSLCYALVRRRIVEWTPEWLE
ncbi:metal-dependent hydrolase [Natronobiforma cellulositropha]|uniref:metal-dependent hydrolase n=1 Tax=Natronobiforma cellulositropha TaxID=1679076 RepID=UPI0021D5C3BA|nr:metal-dependent hydrolase [Natronobiforma cellulositropha]